MSQSERHGDRRVVAIGRTLMKLTNFCFTLCFSAVVALTANALAGTSVNVLQIEAYDGGTPHYSPVNFAGSSTITSGSVTYYALSETGSTSTSTSSGHAATVSSCLLTGDKADSISKIYCLTADDFLKKYVLTSSSSMIAPPPQQIQQQHQGRQQ